MHALRHDGRSGRFSNSQGLSAGFSFLSSLPRLAPFFARSLVPSSLLRNLHGNACYAGYALLLLLNKHFVRSLRASRGRNTQSRVHILFSYEYLVNFSMLVVALHADALPMSPKCPQPFRNDTNRRGHGVPDLSGSLKMSRKRGTG